MKNWIKIQTFDRMHQAELRKDILDQNGINSVILNEKDSLFLLGNIELFVAEKDEKKARVLIDEFSGLTKINSFIDMKPILLFQKILQDGGIKTEIKRRESDKYLLGNYELYIKNELLEKTIPYLTGEGLTGWKKILTNNKVRQTKFYIDLLSENLINSIIIKKKDSEHHLEQINIFVRDEDFEKSFKIIDTLEDFTLVKKSNNLAVIEKLEEVLAKESIKALIKKLDQNFKLFVEKKNIVKVQEIIDSEKEWSVLKNYGNISNAMYHKDVLDSAGIPSVIMNEKDSSFLFGDIELFVEKEYLERAKEIINNLS